MKSMRVLQSTMVLGMIIAVAIQPGVYSIEESKNHLIGFVANDMDANNLIHTDGHRRLDEAKDGKSFGLRRYAKLVRLFHKEPSLRNVVNIQEDIRHFETGQNKEREKLRRRA